MSNFQIGDLFAINLFMDGVSFSPGAIVPIISTTTPSGWLICDGKEISKTTYYNLYAAIGDTYNLGTEQSGKFRVPNIIDKILIQKQSAINVYGGSNSHSHSVNANLSAASTSVNHNHPTNTYNNSFNQDHGHGVTNAGGGGTDNNPVNANKTGTGGAAVVAGAGHTHAVNAYGNTGNAYVGAHSHGMGVSLDASNHTHDHTGTPTQVNTDAASVVPKSLYVRYIVKI